MDEATLNLVITLQKEELESLVSGQKGKAKDGSALTDNQLALELQRAEFEKHETILADLRMARSISRADQDDGDNIAILLAEERRFAQDRETACRMSDQPHHQVSSLPDCRVDEEILSRSGPSNIRQGHNEIEEDISSCHGDSVISFNDQITGESSSGAAGKGISTSKGKGIAKNQCVSCSKIQNTVQVPCQHHYCKECVTNVVTNSTVDESPFPPRCCGQEMPISLLRPWITTELALRFEQKVVEFGTPDPTYCFSCGGFINPDRIQDRQASCATCDLNTCMLCKGQYHPGDCANDAATEAVLELAKQTGWQRCRNCQAMVERREGCNHMTCRCGHQFCYGCGQEWKVEGGCLCT